MRFGVICTVDRRPLGDTGDSGSEQEAVAKSVAVSSIAGRIQTSQRNPPITPAPTPAPVTDAEPRSGDVCRTPLRELACRSPPTTTGPNEKTFSVPGTGGIRR